MRRRRITEKEENPAVVAVRKERHRTSTMIKILASGIAGALTNNYGIDSETYADIKPIFERLGVTLLDHEEATREFFIITGRRNRAPRPRPNPKAKKKGAPKQ